MNKAACILTFASVFLLMGCSQSALLRTLNENTAAETRIAVKQQELKAEQDQRAVLLREQKKLVEELGTKQLTFDELDRKLDDLLRNNARLKADTEAQQKQKRDLEWRLKEAQGKSKEYRKKISDVENNDRFSENVKKKRIAELRKEIEQHFEFLLL